MNELAHDGASLGSGTAIRSAMTVARRFCQSTNAAMQDIQGSGQTRVIAGLRHELMYFLRQHTILSHTAIGAHLGGRDMSTVHEAVAKVAERIASNPEYRDRMRQLQVLILAADFEHPSANLPNDAEVAVRVALSILQSGDLSDAEARLAATDILTRKASFVQEAVHAR